MLTGIRELASSTKVTSPFDHIVLGQIVNVLEETGQVEVLFADDIGKRILPVLHPYIGPNGWHRTMPDLFTYVMVGFRKSNANYARILAYVDPDEKNRLDRSTVAKKETPLVSPWAQPQTQSTFFPYRTLRATEQEIRTIGDASLFFSKRGRISLHGGPVTLVLNKDDLEALIRTPVFKVEISTQFNTLDDCYRIGVIERPRPKEGFDEHSKTYPKSNNKRLREEYLKLNWKGKPETLVLQQQGHCVLVTKNKDENFYTSDQLDRPYVRYWTKESRTRKFFTLTTDGGPSGSQSGDNKPYGEEWSVFGDRHFYLPKHPNHLHGYQINIPDPEQGHYRRNIAVDEEADVGHDMNYHIHNNRTVAIDKNDTLSVGANLSIAVNKSRLDTVVQDWTIKVGTKLEARASNMKFLADTIEYGPKPPDGPLSTTGQPNLNIIRRVSAQIDLPPIQITDQQIQSLMAQIPYSGNVPSIGTLQNILSAAPPSTTGSVKIHVGDLIVTGNIMAGGLYF